MSHLAVKAPSQNLWRRPSYINATRVTRVGPCARSRPAILSLLPTPAPLHLPRSQAYVSLNFESKPPPPPLQQTWPEIPGLGRCESVTDRCKCCTYSDGSTSVSGFEGVRRKLYSAKGSTELARKVRRLCPTVDQCTPILTTIQSLTQGAVSTEEQIRDFVEEVGVPMPCTWYTDPADETAKCAPDGFRNGDRRRDFCDLEEVGSDAQRLVDFTSACSLPTDSPSFHDCESIRAECDPAYQPLRDASLQDDRLTFALGATVHLDMPFMTGFSAELHAEVCVHRPPSSSAFSL